VQHRGEIVFPFKRYQIQPVWRADRPQKGRYREFFQCDVDVIGSDSILNELELIQIIDQVFESLKVGAQIKINNRKVLAGIAEFAGVPERITDITVALDKFEKIGWDKVKEELYGKGINNRSIKDIERIINVIHLSNAEKLIFLRRILLDFPIGLEGIKELEELFHLLEKVHINSSIVFDLTLARGLNYYTGAIIEVKSTDINIGSICGGGRYDNLTGIFGLPGVSGVGVSFGADRIYDVMDQLNLFEKSNSSSTKVLLLNFGEAETEYGLKVLRILRDMNIRAELYPDQISLKKQMSYANSKKIPFILMAGENEINNNCIKVKNMSSGEQKAISMKELKKFAENEIRQTKGIDSLPPNLKIF
jgi:histidyl-tRNA synthetase